MLKKNLLINVKLLTSFNKNNSLNICVIQNKDVPLQCKSKAQITELKNKRL